MTVVTIAFTIVAAGCSVYFTFAIFHILRTVRAVPTLRAGLATVGDDASLPSVCVVVPAHNEEDVIAHVARSLRAQDYPRLRAVFSLDRCTDSTESVLRDALAGDDRFEIILAPPRPEG